LIAETNLLTFNVYDRVFFVHGLEYGTAFTLDYDKRQYLVTARHIIGPSPDRTSIQLFHDKQWKPFNTQVVGIGTGEIDVAVLAPSIQLSPEHKLEPSVGGFLLGQDMFFAGYPFKMWADGGEHMYGRPLPFVKKGILSAFETLSETKILWVDAINNEGFSGGPLVFLSGGSNELKVTGVVSKFRVAEEPVLDAEYKPTGMCVQYHAGFLIAYSIKHVVDLIDRNPIGFPLRGNS
jgi:trypsin-like peptidase